MARVSVGTARRLSGTDAVLYVEGQGEWCLERHALDPLLGPVGVEVRAIGGCEEIEAAYRALRWADETGSRLLDRDYYCVVDRDHRPDDEVEARWAEFIGGKPKPLYWRRHEMENYFLEPAFLAQSDHLKPGKTARDLERKLLQVAQPRVYLDCANLVLKALRDELRVFDLREFGMGEADFDSAGSARAALLAKRDYALLKRRHQKPLSEKWLSDCFDEFVGTMTGATDGPLQPGVGRWLERMEGKMLLPQLVTAQHFLVQGGDGRPVQGARMIRPVVEDLMRRFDGLDHRPRDLMELRDFFARRER